MRKFSSKPGHPFMKFCGVIALIVVLLSAFNGWVRTATPFGESLNTLTAELAGWILQLVGFDAAVVGNRVATSRFVATVGLECTPFFVLSILVAGMLATPAPWKSRLVAIALGGSAIFLVNAIRVASLAVLGGWMSESAFERVHLLVWQPIMLFFCAFVWIVWITRPIHPGVRQQRKPS